MDDGVPMECITFVSNKKDFSTFLQVISRHGSLRLTQQEVVATPASTAALSNFVCN